MNAKFLNFLSLAIVLGALYFALAATSISAQELKIPRGSKVVVRNDCGSITITGGERETIEAVATDVTALARGLAMPDAAKGVLTSLKKA